MTIEAARLSVVVDADTDKAERGLRGIGGSLGAAGMAALGFAAAGLGIAGVAGSVNFAKDAFLGMEQALVPVGTLLGQNSEKMAEMEEAIKKVVESSPASADDVGNAAYMILSAGITDTALATDALTQSQKLAAAGLGDMSQSTDLITSAMNSFKGENLSAEKAAQIFFGTIASGKTTTADLAQGFGQLAPLASSAGIKFEDLMAATAALTSTGQSASTAYAGMKGAISAIIAPTAEAAETAKQLGIDFSQAHLASVGLPAFLQEVQTATGGNVETMAQLFGGVEGLNTVLALTGPQADAFAANLTGVAEAGKSLDERAAEVNSTLGNLWKQGLNIVKVKLYEVGSAIVDFLRPHIEDFINFVKQYWPEVQRIFSEVADFVAQAWQKITDTLGPATVAVAGFGALLDGDVRDQVTGLFNDVNSSPAMGQFGDKVDQLGSKLRDDFGPVFQQIAETVGPILEDMSAFFGEKMAEMQAWVDEIWPQIEEAITHVMNVVSDIVNFVLDGIKLAWSLFGDEILAIVGIVWEMIKGTIGAALEFIKGLIEFILAVINGDWGKAWDAIVQMVKAAMDFTHAIIKAALEAVWQVVLMIWSAIRAAFDAALNAILGIMQGIWNGIVGVFQGLWGAISGGIESVKNGIISAFTFARDIVSGLWNGIFDGLKGAWNAVADTINGFGVTIPNPLPGDNDFRLEIPEGTIPYFAKGGIVMPKLGGTLGVLAEAGKPEAVIPLDRLGDFGGSTYQIVVHAGMGTDGDEVGEKIVDVLRRYERSNTSSWRDASGF